MVRDNSGFIGLSAYTSIPALHLTSKEREQDANSGCSESSIVPGDIGGEGLNSESVSGLSSTVSSVWGSRY